MTHRGPWFSRFKGMANFEKIGFVNNEGNNYVKIRG
jgi:hypothetical protein